MGATAAATAQVREQAAGAPAAVQARLPVVPGHDRHHAGPLPSHAAHAHRLGGAGRGVGRGRVAAPTDYASEGSHRLVRRRCTYICI